MVQIHPQIWDVVWTARASSLELSITAWSQPGPTTIVVKKRLVATQMCAAWMSIVVKATPVKSHMAMAGWELVFLKFLSPRKFTVTRTWIVRRHFDVPIPKKAPWKVIALLQNITKGITSTGVITRMITTKPVMSRKRNQKERCPCCHKKIAERRAAHATIPRLVPWESVTTTTRG